MKFLLWNLKKKNGRLLDGILKKLMAIILKNYLMFLEKQEPNLINLQQSSLILLKGKV